MSPESKLLDAIFNKWAEGEEVVPELNESNVEALVCHCGGVLMAGCTDIHGTLYKCLNCGVEIRWASALAGKV